MKQRVTAVNQPISAANTPTWPRAKLVPHSLSVIDFASYRSSKVQIDQQYFFKYLEHHCYEIAIVYYYNYYIYSNFEGLLF